MKFYVVHFHADGGQACVPGVRCFEDKSKAEQFAASMLAEPGHTCVDHPRIEESDIRIESDGRLYPEVANVGR